MRMVSDLCRGWTVPTIPPQESGRHNHIINGATLQLHRARHWHIDAIVPERYNSTKSTSWKLFNLQKSDFFESGGPRMIICPQSADASRMKQRLISIRLFVALIFDVGGNNGVGGVVPSPSPLPSPSSTSHLRVFSAFYSFFFLASLSFSQLLGVFTFCIVTILVRYFHVTWYF